ncbi:MAG: T9SS type A sorting domain-containing protein [Bacteroidetes bacterium]|nr:T9SS type A sorting domain-containing protein [Bacteroidota bacterium]
MKKSLILILLLTAVAFSEISAQWAVWDGSTLPEVTEMNGVLFTKSDKTSGITDAETSVITFVIDDPDIAGNKLISINEFDGDKKESWRSEWNITDPTVGITCVFRVRPSDEMIAATKVEGNDYTYWYVSLRDGQSRLDLHLDLDTLVAEQADEKIAFANSTDWHIIRFTLQNGTAKVYVDENSTPIFDVVAGGSSNNYMKVGETSTGGLYGSYLDWMVWDVSGAYGPGEGTPLPETLSGLTSVDKFNAELPSNFELSQNYPNPFNPSTQISFSIVNPGFTSLDVFNLLGQKVAQLVNEELAVGTYKVNFNAVNLPSGIYLYRIKSGLFNDVKKMMLVK